MDTPVSQPAGQTQLRHVWPLWVAWIIIAAFVLWGIMGVYGFESILSNFYFLLFWVLTLIVELILLLTFFIKSCVDFFRARKVGDKVLRKKITIRQWLNLFLLFVRGLF
jgi:hypothetical protein